MSILTLAGIVGLILLGFAGIVVINLVSGWLKFRFETYKEDVLRDSLPHFEHNRHCPNCNRDYQHIKIKKGISQCSELLFTENGANWTRNGCGFRWVQVYKDDLNPDKEMDDKITIKDIIE